MPDNPSNTRIKKLSPLLINQLAAGEVVTRPAAVAKELLENAIDAGASNIEIHITQGGMGMIEVVDNGVGIHPDDMVMAITRHATSKVADVANLHGIRTLGFRGEALAATAAVSRLTLTSSHDGSGIGRQLQVAGVLDGMPKLIPVVHHRGTTITVKDLYFNVPARRGNLKSIATEFGHIEAIVREVALARADVALTLFHDNKKRLSLSSRSIDNGNHNSVNRLPLSRLEQATGSSLTDNALEIAIDISSLIQSSREYAGNSFGAQASINGWLWPITDAQDALPKLLYVNGRLVKEVLISNQLRQLAQSAQLKGIGYALYFDLPTEWLNINVHPSKQRIKISPLNNIMAHLSHAIQSKLKNIAVNEQIAKNDNSQVESDISISAAPINQQTLKTVLAVESHKSYLSPQRDALESKQVSEFKQLYQLSEQSYSSEQVYEAQSSEVDGFTEDTRQDAASTNTVSDPNERLIKSAILPYCLDVIYPESINNLDSLLDSSLDGLAVDSTAIKSMNDATLPWLLFYNQGKFLLISETDWHSKISSLFESQILSKQVLSNQGLSNNVSKKDEMLDSAAYINQQLATVKAQMTEQDLMVFVADIESLLINNAVKIIDSHQLVALMLSSKNE